MDALTIAAISVCAAEKRAAYRLIRKTWAAEIGFPFPKRKRRDIRPEPNTIDSDELEG